MPLISVIIPTFNRGDMLRKAILSVTAQAGENFEIVVSDNCSTDHTPAVMAEFATDPRVVCSRNDRNLGMVGNWRKAIYELARGDWFVLMSDDDFLTDPQYLAKASAAINAHHPAFVYSGGAVHDIIAGTEEIVAPPFSGLVPGAEVFASRGTVLPQDVLLPSMVFRRADAQRLGFLSDPDNLSCDSELYLKLCSEGSVFVIQSPACVYLKHGANLIYKVKTTRRLLVHNLDHLVEPFAYARARGLPTQVLERYRLNTRLDHSVGSALLRLRLHDERWYQECRDRVAARIPDVVADIEASSHYRLRRLLIAIAGPILRRRYPLEDTVTGAH